MKAKKGISTDIMGIILLIVALALIVILYLVFTDKGKALLQGLLNVFTLE